MNRFRRAATAVVTLSLVAFIPAQALAFGGSGVPSPSQPQSGQSSQGQQSEHKPPPEQKPTGYADEVVVTASRTEQLLLDAPTAVTLLDGALLTTSPAANYADLLRTVPGLNISQTSARDINVTSRAATNTLATSQLVLLDGRTVYQDFFGFVLWDLLPVSFNEVDSIEVQRGPSSAVWGANAMTGVVNVRTKSPSQMGNSTSIRAGGGEQSTGFVSALHSGVRNNWGYKVSGSYFSQDAWPRPDNNTGVVFPDSRNQGTTQPKFDGRVDYLLGPTENVSLRGGYAGTDGIIYTGIGPFDIKNGSWSSYFRGDYNRDMVNVRFFANLLDADSINQLNGLPFNFKTGVYDVSAQNTTILQDGRHMLVYGGNYRYQTFDLSIAPAADPRSEGGAFLQDSWQPHDRVLVTLGARVDGFSVLDNAVFSPRVGVQFAPISGEDHYVRVSWGRAFRAPSAVNNFLGTTIFNEIDLAPLGAVLGIPMGPYVFPIAAVGNPDLVEEQLDQIEIGYRGVINNNIAIDFAWYYTETKDNIDFFASEFYSPFDPPPGWLGNFPPGFPPTIALGTLFFLPSPLPKTFTYRNIGLIKNQGVEIGIRGRPNPSNEIYANYTWQKQPDPEGIDLSELNIPPGNLFNIGLAGSYQSVMYNVGVNYQGEAFWADVLDARFHGPTEAATTLNLTFGYDFPQGFTVSVRSTNVTNVDFQQHYWGDVIGRRVLVEAGWNIDWDNR